MNKKEIFDNVIAEYVKNQKPYEPIKWTHEVLTKEEKIKRHTETLTNIIRMMAESNKAKMESGEVCI